ncbi:MAG: response regulator [Balneola sp.]|nr:response regulator [Balneola sp.]MBO6651378.1 response regulator [Balneola sp.]MBO6710996.1 response regulator [Balneola sp.]MBO6801512.1 response regulator [Balneola sp.]MBO6870416.1 response regulator [Balneola sp.]
MSNLKKVLYVDDEAMNLFLFENLLAENFEIVTAKSPEKGLEILSEDDSFDLVISDMKMPGMNGLEFIRKAQEFYKACPYNILSGYHKIPEIEEALESGLICSYLQKPFEVDEITASINKDIEAFQRV